MTEGQILIEQIMKEIGCDKVTDHQYYHFMYGTMFFTDFTYMELAANLFQRGKEAKAKEISKALYIPDHIISYI